MCVLDQAWGGQDGWILAKLFFAYLWTKTKLRSWAHLSILIVFHSEHRVCFSLPTCRFSYSYITRRVIREIKYRIYGKREFVPRDQFSPLLVINLLFIITARKSVDSLQFCPCFELFYLLISHFENFLTWISHLLFGMNAMLNHDLGMTYQTGKFICRAWLDRTFLQALIIWNDYVSSECGHILSSQT